METIRLCVSFFGKKFRKKERWNPVSPHRMENLSDIRNWKKGSFGHIFRVGFGVSVKYTFWKGGEKNMRVSYGYARVSSKQQHLDRQLQALRQFRAEMPEENIFVDQQSGKNFEREQYQKMKVILEHVVKTKKQGDLYELVVEELDRLGRNAKGIREELQWYREQGICVRILEIPTTLAEVGTGNQWAMDLVSSILIEVYSSLAEQELEKRAKRQTEGIAAAKERGVLFGRKPVSFDWKLFEVQYKRWKAGEITATEARKTIGLTAGTFYRNVQRYEKEGKGNSKG